MRSHVSFAAPWLAALAGLVLAAAANAQSPVLPIPGSSVAMAPPKGFRPARGFPGLESAEDGSSITIGELPPDGYAKLAATFASPKAASAGFAGQGIRITRIEQLTVGSAQVPLAVGDQAQNGKQFRKFIALLGGPSSQTNAVLVTFNLTDASPLRQGDVEQALQSVRIARAPTLDDKLAGLPFKFEAVAPFHTSDVLSGTTALLTTFDGSDPTGKKPMLMINRATTQAGPDEMAQTSEKIVRGMSGFADAELAEQKPVTFADGDGYFIAAVAGGRTMLQYLRVLSNGTYVRLVARGETSAMEEARDAVAKIADSVTLSN
jgi:hypothetical protein